MFFRQPYRRPGKGPLVKLGTEDEKNDDAVKVECRRLPVFGPAMVPIAARSGKAGRRDDLWQMMLRNGAVEDVEAYHERVEAEEVTYSVISEEVTATD